MRKKKGCLIISLVTIALFWGVTEFLCWPGRCKEEHVRQADHAAILSVCRQMIATTLSSSQTDFIVGKQDTSFRKTVPSVILELEPSYVHLDRDHVMVCLSAIPRVYVLGFVTNAIQYGGERLIDGLWLSSNPREDRAQALLHIRKAQGSLI